MILNASERGYIGECEGGGVGRGGGGDWTLANIGVWSVGADI